MRFIISYIPITCLLTLLTACSGGDSHSELSIDSVSAQWLMDQISESEQPYVLLGFYQYGCPLCSEELPELVALHKQKDAGIRVIIISINEEDKTDELPEFLAERGVDFPTYHLNPELVNEFIQTRYSRWDGTAPLNLIFTKDGVLVEVTGMTDQKEVRLIVHEHQSFR